MLAALIRPIFTPTQASRRASCSATQSTSLIRLATSLIIEQNE